MIVHPCSHVGLVHEPSGGRTCSLTNNEGIYIYICIHTHMYIRRECNAMSCADMQCLRDACMRVFMYVYTFLLTYTIFKHEDISLIYVSLDLCMVGFKNNNIFCSTKAIYFFVLN